MKKTAGSLMVILFLSFSLVVVTGCGKKTGGPSTVPVVGTLKIGGQPAPGIQINLHPAEPNLQTASGNTDDQGRFELYTGQTGTRGAMVGKFKVVLAQGQGSEMDDSYMAPAEDGKGGADGSAAPKMKTTFPEKYGDIATTDKEISITGATNDLVIEIE